MTRSRTAPTAGSTRRGALVALLLAVMATAVAASPAAASPDGMPPVPPPSHQAIAARGGVMGRRGTGLALPNKPALGTATNLSYGGGNAGIGVTTGSPAVYLVYWGAQWGTPATNTNGDTTFSGDPASMAPYQQEFFKGIGTNGEGWSSVLTQYCQGVAFGTTTCPANAAHVVYPAGTVLAGIWEDTSVSAPLQATQSQLGSEATRAAAHFGNTTAASNRNVQYVITSPTKTHPDGFNTPSGPFCAWHSASLGGTTGAIAFTNMPYLPDANDCGANFRNPGTAGKLDGVSIVGGHEYAETLTDQVPDGGWLDSSGQEDADKCVWISTGQGAIADLALATGSFAVQSTWSNAFNGGKGGCVLSNASAPANTVTVTNPGNQTTPTGTAVNLPAAATDSASGQTFTWSATGLPAGLTINTTTGTITGTITGTPTTASTTNVTLTATDTTSAHGSATFTWTTTSPAANTVTVTNPGNQTTPTGTAVNLPAAATDSASGQTLTWSATGLPAGLTINTATGTITGTPTTASTTNVTLTATDATSAHGSATFTWTTTSATPTLSAPTSIAATPGNTYLSVQWGAPTRTERGTLTGYRVTAVAGATTVTQVVAPDVRQVSLPRLTNGVTYTVNVVATDVVGTGQPGTPVTASPAATKPAATTPPAVAATATGGNRYVTAQWSPPTFDGGSPITMYSVIVANAATNGVLAWHNVGVDVRSASADTLVNGTTYKVEVVAWNARGEGTVTTTNVTPTATPLATTAAAPLWVTATPAARALSVAWGAATSDGGSPITSYTVTVSTAGHVVRLTSTGPDTRLASITALTTGTVVQVTVAATTAKGAGTPSTPITLTVG